MGSDAREFRGPNDPRPVPFRPACSMPDGAVCRFNLWGRCCHSLNQTGVCPLVVIDLGRMRANRDPQWPRN